MSFLSRREIFALIVASISVAILLALGYLLTGWNPANFKGDVLTIMLALFAIIVGIASPALAFGFRPRVLKYLDRTESLTKPENQKLEKIDSQQENRPTRKHTENLRTEVYEELLRMTRIIGVSEPYMMDFVVSQGKEGQIPVENLRYFQRGIEHLHTGESYQRAYELWEYMRTLKCRYNDEVREIRKELKKLIILKMEEYLDTYHEHEAHSSRLSGVTNYFCSIPLLDFMIDEITLSVNRNVKRDFRIMRTQWNSHDGNWYQLEGVSNIGYAILLQSLSPITDQDEARLRQALSEIRDDVAIADWIRDTIELERHILTALSVFRKELKKIIEQIKDIEDNYIIEGSCSACRVAQPQSPIESSNES